MSETRAAEQVVLDAFAEYWRANYGDDCVISSREWHLPKLQGAIRHALRPILAAARREGEAAQQRCEWVATALHGDPMFGPGCDEPLVQQVRALQADLATSRAALEDVRRVVEDVPLHFNSHAYREAILRALAQEAGDG